jgi:hypothetical protein
VLGAVQLFDLGNVDDPVHEKLRIEVGLQV